MLSKKKIVYDDYPEEKPCLMSRRGLAIISFGALLVLVSVNILVRWYLTDHTINRGYWIISQKGKVLSSLTKSGYWLIVGDSSGNFGVVPEVLDKHLGTRSINLCTVADMLTMDDFFMVEAYVDRYGPPAGVLMVHAYDAWPRKGELGAFARSNWPIKKISKFLELRASQQMEMMIKRYFPLYSENTTLTTMSLMPRTAFFRNGLPFTIRPNGYMPLATASSGVDHDAEFHLNRIKSVPPEISKYNFNGLKAIADLAEHYKFNVYMVNSPLYKNLLNHEEFSNYFFGIQEKLKRIVGGYHRLYLLQFDESMTFSANQMENVDHVILTAAKVYTAHVAEKIQTVEQSQDEIL